MKAKVSGVVLGAMLAVLGFEGRLAAQGASKSSDSNAPAAVGYPAPESAPIPTAPEGVQNAGVGATQSEADAAAGQSDAAAERSPASFPEGDARYENRLPPAPPSGASFEYLNLPPRYEYQEGTALPEGYHLEEQPRRGFVTAGYLTAGIPYFVGLMVAASVDFKNASGWLAVPFLGPWMTIGHRRYACIGNEEECRNSLAGLGDGGVLASLIIDGIAQAAGATFLMVGYLSSKQYAVRDQSAVVVAPSVVGSGYGLSVAGLL